MLKKVLFFLFLLAFSTPLTSQSIQEILSYTIDNPNGTARYESMGGAFGALGGDLSAININPASSSVFNDNEYGFTIGNHKLSNNSLFLVQIKKPITLSSVLIREVVFGCGRILEMGILRRFHLA